MVLLGFGGGACSSDEAGQALDTDPVVTFVPADGGASAPTSAPNTTAATPATSTDLSTTTAAPPTTAAATTVPSATASSTTLPSTTVPVTTALSTTMTASGDDVETRVIGASAEGSEIAAVRRGEPGGRVVLVIGVIHGDENDGAAIMERLHDLVVPAGVDLWLVDSMNPDGEAAGTRHNANQVDLNRNFPQDWGPIGVPGDSQYAGPSAASEPETQAIVGFVEEIRPDLIVWYHQDLFRIAPGRGRDGVIRQRYAELTGLPVVSITGGTYTGVAATWARSAITPGVAFIVELGPTLSGAEADTHAAAVLTVAAEPN